GLVDAREPRAGFSGNAYSEEGQLPQSLREALLRFETADPLIKVLGKEFCDVYGAVKWAEQEEFFHIISPWEREHLLVNV
ncbi:MAG: glutamine synthetase, partial [Paracoccaceae bacterium]